MKDSAGREIEKVISTTSRAMKQGRRPVWAIAAQYIAGGHEFQGPLFFDNKKAADDVIKSVRVGM